MSDHVKRLAEIEALLAGVPSGVWSWEEGRGARWTLYVNRGEPITDDLPRGPGNEQHGWNILGGADFDASGEVLRAFILTAPATLRTLLAEHRAASSALEAAGIPDDGRTLAERVKALCTPSYALPITEIAERHQRAEQAAVDAGMERTPHRDRGLLLAEVARQRRVIDRLVDEQGVNEGDLDTDDAAKTRDAAILAAIDSVAAYYPADLFPPDGTSVDAKSGTWARRVVGLVREEVSKVLDEMAPLRAQANEAVMGTPWPATVTPAVQGSLERLAADPALRAAFNVFPGEPPRIVVLPVENRGVAVRAFREEHGIQAADLATALRVSEDVVVTIEGGSRTTDAAGWREIMTQLFLLGATPEDRRAKEAGYLADPMSRPGIERLFAGCGEDKTAAGDDQTTPMTSR